MGFFSKLRTIFRGDVRFADLPREALRRKKAAKKRVSERLNIDRIDKGPARTPAVIEVLSPADRCRYFRERDICFFPAPGSDEGETTTTNLLSYFPRETSELIASADRIANDSVWELAGLGAFKFAGDNCWRLDPLTGADWGLDYYYDVVLYQPGGADIRILWELNRLGHTLTLAGAFALTKNEIYAETFFLQIESWLTQNPYGRGANWNSAMEVALRAINLLAAFDIFRRSAACSESRLNRVLQLFDQHGRFIFENNEFSYIATSNHYLSNVVGLFWIGTLLPELKHAAEWREFGLGQMLGEMDKQILPDGADFESSTGYHKFVTELLLYSFLLADRNGIRIEDRYRDKLRRMVGFIKACIRPDGRMTLIGDADGSRIVPIVNRFADDAAYLGDLSAVVLDEPQFKTPGLVAPEVMWLLGEPGVNSFESLPEVANNAQSVSFPDAGMYIMRAYDLYMHFNVNGCGLRGRGSHGHNDVLSIEMSALGRSFIIDPGSYVYNLERAARHQFRSTAYHSTVMVDGMEQNTIVAENPFVIGNEADPIADRWETSPAKDIVSAEHFGYMRLADPVRHRRTITFDKLDKYWLIEDMLTGNSQHQFSFSFHIAPGLAITGIDTATVSICDDDGRSIYIRAIGLDTIFTTDRSHASRNYGQREDSLILRWSLSAPAPFVARFLVVPSRGDENQGSRLELLDRLTDNIDN